MEKAVNACNKKTYLYFRNLLFLFVLDRVGSEFWKQHESFGDDLTGIKMTLTKTEQGNPVDFGVFFFVFLSMDISNDKSRAWFCISLY